MNRKKKIFIVVIIAEILVLFATGTFLIYINTDTVKVQRQLKNAEHYLSEDDNHNAEKAFEAVLAIAPENEDAYLGLAKIYEDDDEPEKAIRILEKGASKTDSAKITKQLNKYYEKLAPKEDTETAQAVFNESDEISDNSAISAMDENSSSTASASSNNSALSSIFPVNPTLRKVYTPAQIDAALKAYQDKLYEYGESVKCGLFYLNDDNMPECAIFFEDNVYEGVLLYLNGGVTDLTVGFGTVYAYNSRQNILSEHHGMHQTGYDIFYCISEDGKTLETLGGTSYIWSDSSNGMEEIEINGIPSDEQGYNEYLNSFGQLKESPYECAQFTSIIEAYRSLTEQTSVCDTYDFLISRFELSGNMLYIDTVNDSNEHESSVSYPVSSDFRCLRRYTDGSAEEITYNAMKTYLDDNYEWFSSLSDTDMLYDSSPGGFNVIMQSGQIVEICTIWS